ncbi:ArsR/SmtB family transcription factor [Pseudactinotalea sp.]|uniref:ArsR/SmtB family transcription factor n=1 Tax=Pseudactinotalea sp. TaxID=1926260 RepID=UPI003B3B71CC
MTSEKTDVETRLTGLEERLARLEASTLDRTDDNAERAGEPPTDTTAPLWIVDGIRATRAADDLTNGAVHLAGSLTLPDGTPVNWQQGAALDDLLTSSWAPAVQRLAALAHPVRLAILRHLLNGHETTAELAEVEDMGTAGQLHHHLRQLVAAGWVTQRGRGRYTVLPARVVPLLTIVEASL